MKRNVKFVRYSSKRSTTSIIIQVSNFGTILYTFDVPFHITGPKNHAAKHQLRTQNITSNFSEALLILPGDGSQRIRNMSEFLFFKILIHVDFNLTSFIQLGALVGK